jgi:anti-anti-sigma regulatory factor
MPAHLRAASQLRGNTCVIISLQHSFYADSDGIDYLNELIQVLKKENNKIVISGVNKEIQALIVKEAFYKKKLVEGKIYLNTSDALRLG